MAVVIRDGGKEPIVVNSWQTATKDVILDRFYDNGQSGTLVADVVDYVETRLDHKSVEQKYMYRVDSKDVLMLISEMFSDGWLEVSVFALCDIYRCQQKQNIGMAHILLHAKLRLTQKGYDKVNEHIFP